MGNHLITSIEISEAIYWGLITLISAILILLIVDCLESNRGDHPDIASNEAKNKDDESVECE
jgi:hypothetical protein